MSDPADRHEPERLQRECLEELFAQSDLSVFEMFRNFPVFCPRYTIARFLAHYELFKKVIDLPGVILDLGVYRGASTFTWAKLCEIFCPTDVKKIVYAFDTFEGFPRISREDGERNDTLDLKPGGYASGENMLRDLELAQKAMNHDKFIRHLDRIRFIKGDVRETIPAFVNEKGTSLHIALLNLDVDLYQPTKAVLESLIPHMVRGGIIIVDEYAVDEFPGESKAIDEYFRNHFDRAPKAHKFSWHSNPSAYIEVDW